MDKYSIEQQIAELKQKPQLNRRERRYLAKLESKLHPQKEGILPNLKSIATKFIFVLAAVVIIGGIIWYIKTRSNLPPIDLSGHIEKNPPAHIMDTEMNELIQKHMLEHADGKGKPGILIQYNCKKYRCEKDLVEKLKTLVKKYPDNVYLAPANYDGKIILTRLGQRQILSSFDEQQIVDFIVNK